jgi:CARDB
MTASSIRLTIAGFFVLALIPVGIAAPGLVAKSPDLVPIASRMKTGTVSVRNIGSAASGDFVITVECNQQGATGGCAEDPGMAAYEDAAYPNRVVVKVKSLAPGKVFNHKLAFWNNLDWESGNYQFDVVADAGTAVAETNEGNNDGSYVLSVP